MLGYFFALLAMVSFGLLGIFHKVADRKQCTPFMITVTLFASSTAIMFLWVGLFRSADFSPPGAVVAVAVPFGIITAVSLWVFQYGIRFGKITTSWVIINLSAAVPTVLSTVLYQENLDLRKIVVLVLIALAILLLWKDMQDEKRQGRREAAEEVFATPVMGESDQLPPGER